MHVSVPTDGPVALESLLQVADHSAIGVRPTAAHPNGSANGHVAHAKPGAAPPPRSISAPVPPTAPSAGAPTLKPNRLQWRGRVATSPEVRRSHSGIDYCTVRVLQNVLNTQRQAVTQAVEIVMFRERAHDFARSFRKGDFVEIVGELRIREWKDQAGATHTSVSLHPSEEVALISRPSSSRPAA